MDEPALKQLLDDLLSGAVTPDEAVSRLRRLPFTRISVSQRSTTTGPCGNDAVRRSTRRERPPEQCAAIVADLLDEPGDNPVLLTRADADQVAGLPRPEPGRIVTTDRTGVDRGVAARASETLGRVLLDHRRNRRPGSRRRMPGGSGRVTASGPSFLPIAESQVSIACWRRSTNCRRPTPSSSSPAWRAPSPASSPG